MKIILIVAVGKNKEIGKNNQLLWHLPIDLKHFKQLTTGYPIVMGRRTYESIGKALPNRLNIVLCSNNIENEEVISIQKPSQALKIAQNSGADTLFVIGGASVYEAYMPLATDMYITEVETELEADVFFPNYDADDWEIVQKHAYYQNNKHAYNFQIIHYNKR